MPGKTSVLIMDIIKIAQNLPESALAQAGLRKRYPAKLLGVRDETAQAITFYRGERADQKLKRMTGATL